MLNLDSLKTAMRKRHKLADDAPLAIKVLPADVRPDDTDHHLFSATITQNISDRDDEAVLPIGMIAKDFDTSGAIFWSHDYQQPVAIPVGKLVKTADSVTAKARFMERPAGYVGEFFPDFARAFVTQMSKAGRKPGVSIGFIPIESRKPSAKDRAAYGDQCRNVITRWKLLEWSIAPVQANPESYVTAVGKSIGPAACKALFGVELKEEAPPKVEAPPRRTVVILEVPMLAKAELVREPVNVETLVKAHVARRRGWPLYV